MGNSLVPGPPHERIVALNADVSHYPPWICVSLALGMDLACTPFMCRDKWREILPFGLADKGQWFSPEFSTYDLFGWYDQTQPYLSFDEFRAQRGVDGETNTAQAWLISLYEYIFCTHSTKLSNMFTPIALCTILALVCVIRCIKSYCMPKFQNIGRQWAIRAHGEDWLQVPTNQERVIKFGEYIYRLCYHSFVALWGVYLFWDAPWWNKDQGGTMNLFTFQNGSESQPGMTWYYLIQGAYNAEAMLWLLETSFEVIPRPSKNQFNLPFTIGWSESVRSDFTEMMVHHVVTNALIFLSSYFRQQRIGSMVFWMHDISDVPVDLAKLANFVKWKRATVTAFITLCVVWIITRLYAFPFIIWKAIFTQSIEMVGYQNVPLNHMYLMQPIFVVLLGMLILLHCFWFGMFIKMGYVLVTTGKAADYSEKSENHKLKIG